MNVDTTNREAARNMVVAGIGIGAMMQVFVLSVQNAVSRSRIGSATALTQFGRQMGATLGVTIMGVLVNHGLPRGVAAAGAACRPRGCDPSRVPRRSVPGSSSLGDRGALREGAGSAPLPRRGGGC